MARYIDAEMALKIIDSYSKTVSADGKVVVDAIRDIVGIITPTADVVPKSEADNWYQLYHSIKEELKQEKMYHRETDKLCDRYYIESQHAKRQVAREIFEEIESVLSYSVYPQIRADGTIKTIKSNKYAISVEDYNTIKKKYVESVDG